MTPGATLAAVASRPARRAVTRNALGPACAPRHGESRACLPSPPCPRAPRGCGPHTRAAGAAGGAQGGVGVGVLDCHFRRPRMTGARRRTVGAPREGGRRRLPPDRLALAASSAHTSVLSLRFPCVASGLGLGAGHGALACGAPRARARSLLACAGRSPGCAALPSVQLASMWFAARSAAPRVLHTVFMYSRSARGCGAARVGVRLVAVAAAWAGPLPVPASALLAWAQCLLVPTWHGHSACVLSWRFPFYC